jgi:hypothetical protein
MDTTRLLHLAVLFLWGGVVLAELVVELAASHEEAARIHYFIDLFVEVPLIAGVLTTGGFLVARAWPLHALLWWKVGAALTAITLNLYCVVEVVLRYRRRADPAALARHRRGVFFSTAGIPFAAVAAYLGLRYFL